MKKFYFCVVITLMFNSLAHSMLIRATRTSSRYFKARAFHAGFIYPGNFLLLSNKLQGSSDLKNLERARIPDTIKKSTIPIDFKVSLNSLSLANFSELNFSQLRELFAGSTNPSLRMALQLASAYYLGQNLEPSLDCLEFIEVHLKLITNFKTSLIPHHELLSDENLAHVLPYLEELNEQPIEILNLRGCALKKIPTNIGKLSNLYYLDLRDNQITDISPEIGGLEKLIILELGGNKITSFPKDIRTLIHVKTLYLQDNNITQIPANIAALVNLRFLYLNNNQISFIHDNLKELKKLRTLEIENNKLSTLPNVVFGLSALVEARAWGNEFIYSEDEDALVAQYPDAGPGFIRRLLISEKKHESFMLSPHTSEVAN